MMTNGLDRIAIRQRSTRLGAVVFAVLVALSVAASVTSVATAASAASVHSPRR